MIVVVVDLSHIPFSYRPNAEKAGGKKESREEARTKGTVAWSLHKKYFSAGNGLAMFGFFMLATLAAQVFTSASDYWLKVWYLF